MRLIYLHDILPSSILRARGDEIWSWSVLTIVHTQFQTNSVKQDDLLISLSTGFTVLRKLFLRALLSSASAGSFARSSTSPRLLLFPLLFLRLSLSPLDLRPLFPEPRLRLSQPPCRRSVSGAASCERLVVGFIVVAGALCPLRIVRLTLCGLSPLLLCCGCSCCLHSCRVAVRQTSNWSCSDTRMSVSPAERARCCESEQDGAGQQANRQQTTWRSTREASEPMTSAFLCVPRAHSSAAVIASPGKTSIFNRYVYDEFGKTSMVSGRGTACEIALGAGVLGSNPHSCLLASAVCFTLPDHRRVLRHEAVQSGGQELQPRHLGQ